MPAYDVTTSFEMTDGRILECTYVLSVTPARLWGAPENCYPEESEASEGVFTIDGEEVDYDNLPKGLAVIADKLEQAGPGEFGYNESLREPDYEPDFYDYD
ncbi:hypothetical protein P7I17_gp34 [Escherichia phage Halfdan]|uniref:Uncharacterized protein n=1 Tax=Escherichia phage Halfdan TaxID=2234092 RepID=A0A2Z5H546_9CAUD|nr:hypothetical protein P7I17_gp34 [Escherichia phage Halfdan]AXC34288.1 hypothetical protein [Escherichia phage Halfdan]